MFVERETTADVWVIAEGSVGQRQILNRCVGNPNGVGSKVVHGRRFPDHIDGRTVVVGVIKSHQGRDARRRGSLADDVLQRCGGYQLHFVNVPVEPNIVSDHTNRVDLSVDERDAIQRGHNGLVIFARIDDSCLGKTVHACHVILCMLALLDEHGVEGTVFSAADVPLHHDATAFIVGHIAGFCSHHRVWSVVVVQFTGWDHRANHGHVGEILLSCGVNAGETDPHRHAGGLGDHRLIAFVGGIGGVRRSPEGVDHRCGGDVHVGAGKVKRRASSPFKFNVAIVSAAAHGVGSCPQGCAGNFITGRRWTERCGHLAPSSVGVFCNHDTVVIRAVFERHAVRCFDVGCQTAVEGNGLVRCLTK